MLKCWFYFIRSLVKWRRQWPRHKMEATPHTADQSTEEERPSTGNTTQSRPEYRRGRPSTGTIAGWWQHQSEDDGKIVVRKYYEKYLALQILYKKECWQNNHEQQVSNLQTFFNVLPTFTVIHHAWWSQTSHKWTALGPHWSAHLGEVTNGLLGNIPWLLTNHSMHIVSKVN